MPRANEAPAKRDTRDAPALLDDFDGTTDDAEDLKDFCGAFNISALEARRRIDLLREERQLQQALRDGFDY